MQEERQRSREREGELEYSRAVNEEMPVEQILEAEMAAERMTAHSDGSGTGSVGMAWTGPLRITSCPSRQEYAAFFFVVTFHIIIIFKPSYLSDKILELLCLWNSAHAWLRPLILTFVSLSGLVLSVCLSVCFSGCPCLCVGWRSGDQHLPRCRQAAVRSGGVGQEDSSLPRPPPR